MTGGLTLEQILVRLRARHAELIADPYREARVRIAAALPHDGGAHAPRRPQAKSVAQGEAIDRLLAAGLPTAVILVLDGVWTRDEVQTARRAIRDVEVAEGQPRRELTPLPRPPAGRLKLVRAEQTAWKEARRLRARAALLRFDAEHGHLMARIKLATADALCEEAALLEYRTERNRRAWAAPVGISFREEAKLRDYRHDC